VGQAHRPRLDGVCIEHFLLSPPLVTSLRQAGVSVTTGTVNHPQMLTPLLALSLDAITSDCPHQLPAALAEPPSAPRTPRSRSRLPPRTPAQAR
jgi:hypothetical protein